jgi:hypothetical protein
MGVIRQRDDMTEYEFLDFTNSSVSLIVQSGFNFISVFFAYIVCAYLVGSKISRIQAIALTTAYTIYLSFSVLTIVTAIGRQLQAAIDYAPEMIVRFQIMQIAGPSLLTFIWFISIVYMFSQNSITSQSTEDAV